MRLGFKLNHNFRPLSALTHTAASPTSLARTKKQTPDCKKLAISINTSLNYRPQTDADCLISKNLSQNFPDRLSTTTSHSFQFHFQLPSLNHLNTDTVTKPTTVINNSRTPLYSVATLFFLCKFNRYTTHLDVCCCRSSKIREAVVRCYRSSKIREDVAGRWSTDAEQS